MDSGSPLLLPGVEFKLHIEVTDEALVEAGGVIMVVQHHRFAARLATVPSAWMLRLHLS